MEKTDNTILFCDLLQTKLEQYKLSQSELACKLKIHRSIVSNLTAGRHTPNLKLLMNLANIFSNDCDSFQSSFFDLCTSVIRSKGEA